MTETALRLGRRSTMAVLLAPGVLVAAELVDIAVAHRVAIDIAAVVLLLLFAPHGAADRRHRIACAVLAFALLPVGLGVRSPLLMSAGLVAVAGAVDGRRTATTVRYIVPVLATMGIAIVYLHTATLWAGELAQGLVGPIGRLLGLSGGGAHLFVAGHHVHASLLSPMAAFWTSLAAALAASLSWRRSLLLMVISAVVLTGSRASLLFLLVPSGFVGAEPWLVLVLAMVATGVGVALVVPVEISADAPPLGSRSVAAGSTLAVVVLLATTTPWSRVEEIAIDEAHGRWETTEATYTPSGYGRHTVYNYSLLRRWLEERFTVRTLKEAPIAPTGDLLLVKTPTHPYAPEERRAIRGFVQRGGRLLVFADHTDLFGSSSIVNQLLEDYGLEVESTATMPLSGVTRRLPGRWWNGSGLVAPGTHLDLQTTATLRGQGGHSLLTESLLVDLGVAAERADYSNERRFGELTVTADDAFAPAPAVAVRRYGQGTVVVVADSTPWSNFSLLAPGNRELIRGLLDVVEQPPVPLQAALMVALLILMMAITAIHRLGLEALLWFFAALSIGWAGLALADSFGNHEAVRFRSGRSLVVLGEWSDVSWDTDIRLGTSVDRTVFSLFLSTMPRIGIYPEMVRDFDIGPDTELAALIDVARPLSARRLFELEDWVRQGGTLLVLDDPLWRGSEEVLPVLRRFGFGYGIQVERDGIWKAGGPPVPGNVFLLPLLLLQDHRRERGERLLTYGGAEDGLSSCDPLWVDESGLVVLGERQVGKGRVLVFLRSRVFSQLVMGDVWGGVEAGRYREELYELEYRLLSLLAARRGDEAEAGSGEIR